MTKENAQLKRAIAMICGLLLAGVPSFAAEGAMESHAQRLQTRMEDQRTRFGVTASAVSFSVKGESIRGGGVGLGVRHALSDDLGVTGGFDQAFNAADASPLYSAANLGLIYALTGNLISRRQETISVGGTEVLSRQERHRGGLRFQLHSDLFFFNSTVSAVAFTGFGAVVSYEFPSSNSRGYDLGLRADSVNGSVADSITPMQLVFGISF